MVKSVKLFGVPWEGCSSRFRAAHDQTASLEWIRTCQSVSARVRPKGGKSGSCPWTLPSIIRHTRGIISNVLRTWYLPGTVSGKLSGIDSVLK